MLTPQLGFGSLRLEKDKNKNLIEDSCRKLVREYIDQGGVYFEVAYAYPQTEEVIGKILTEHPRDSFLLTDKMPVNDSIIKCEEDYYTVFQEQLKRCKVSFFDCYLLHNLGFRTYQLSDEYGAFRFLKHLKETGLAKQVGFSFHDRAEVLDSILSKYSELIDIVQLQINYLDWDSPVIQSRQCYEVARKYQKDIFVMEPIKGGRLSSLPAEAMQLIREKCPGETPSSLALRFAASLDNVKFVLSGMTEPEQIRQNLEIFKDFRPLSETEKETLEEIAGILRGKQAIECTQCRYCEKVCPKKIPIPDLFHLYENDNKNRVGRMYIRITAEQNRGKASDCIKCGRCEQECSQHLPIRKLLNDVREVYEPNTLAKNKIKKKVKSVIGEQNIKQIKKLLGK